MLTKLTKDAALEFDCLRIQQVTINLLSNALKFTKPHDTIDVRISLQEFGDSEEVELKIQVTDKGIGISEDE